MRASQWSESGRTYLPSLRAYKRFDLWKYVSSLPTIKHVSLMRAGTVVITYSDKIVSPTPISA